MKKKKKTLYIRRNRIRFDKKRTIKFYEAQHFLNKFIIHFRRKINIMKKKNFIKFLKRFQSTNFNKVYNYIKMFGMNRSYKFNNFYYRSERSEKLFSKFKIKKVKKNYLKKKKKEIENLQKKHFLLFFQPINFKKNKLKNIEFKKQLCLYFSYRHLMFLPVRGQRTKTNAKTRKDFCIV